MGVCPRNIQYFFKWIKRSIYKEYLEWPYNTSFRFSENFQIGKIIDMFVLPYTHPWSPCSLLTLMLFLPPDTAPKAAKTLAVNPTNSTIDPQPTVDNDISVTCRRRNQYSNQWHNMFNPRLIDPWSFRKKNDFIKVIISAGSIWIYGSCPCPV